MAGLYPNDEAVTVFGTEVLFPGLDPQTHKFTNGDFSNPLIKPSFIPAETINLILDNLQTFISGLGCTPNNTETDQLLNALNVKLQPYVGLEDIYYIGSTYTQKPGDYTPSELKAMGKMPPNSVWEVWNHRANQYGLISASLPVYTIYTPGNNYAANAYVTWHLPGDNWTLYKAKAAITNAASDLDPVLWDEFPPAVLVNRKDLQGWADSDFEIGDQISGSLYNGWTVCKIETLGGKFSSYDGGNRPPFESGTAGDMQRLLEGSILGVVSLSNIFPVSRGVFLGSFGSGTSFSGQGIQAFLTDSTLRFNNANSVVTGKENSSRALSELVLRRVA